ncbi:MAG: DNA-binding transcriptional repressor LldR [Smithella sp. PtaU1.Bin162]|nr:MAG: DNA-binding transcriptional repressor LldR [Smithella sp. PtaU1.Bin162]
MSNKINMVRDYIITALETKNLVGGDKLPGAREFSEQLGVSHAVTQMAFISLVRDGILDSIPRSGTFVRHDWFNRLLPNSFYLFRRVWTDLLRDRLPGVEIHESFRRGVFEIRTTLDVLQNREDYMDLSAVLGEIYPDMSDFFSLPFRSFRTAAGQLFGIPLVFSPRVLCYNPAMLQTAGCPEPRSGWSWDEFIDDISKLRRHYVADRIFNWGFDFSAMNFIFRAGGGIIDTTDNCSVRLDQPETRQGIALVRQLYRALGVRSKWPEKNPYTRSFRQGECAFFMAARQDVDFRSQLPWKSVPLPLIPGGADVTAQATDLLCIRQQGGDPTLARDIIRLMLSPEIQDKIGELRYGIPIRKSSAMRSFDPEDPRDALFLSEMTKISAEYNFDSRELTRLVIYGLYEIWLNDADLDQTVDELAAALRTMLRYRHFEIKPTVNNQQTDMPEGKKT